MAERIEPFNVTFPAGTPIATPVTVQTQFADGDVERLEIDVPAGPSGLVGFKVLYSSVSVIPYRSGVYIITDDAHLVWDMHGYGTSGRWSFQGYNTDIYDHTIGVRWFINELRVLSMARVPDLPIG